MSPETQHHTKCRSQAAGWLLQLASRCRHSEWHICDYCSNISSTAAPRYALLSRFYRGLWRVAARITVSDKTWLCYSEIKPSISTLKCNACWHRDSKIVQNASHCFRKQRDVQMEACLTQQAVDQLISNNGAWFPSCWRQLKSPLCQTALQYWLAALQSATPVRLERWLLRWKVTVFLGSWDSIRFSFSSSVRQLFLLILSESKSELKYGFISSAITKRCQIFGWNPAYFSVIKAANEFLLLCKCLPDSFSLAFWILSLINNKIVNEEKWRTEKKIA